MAANDTQVGGNHYRRIDGEQHWDRQWRLNGRGYFVGCITKYVERYPFKNGIEDLEKARQFLDKLIELEKSTVEQKELTPEELRERIRERGNPYANITDKDE